LRRGSSNSFKYKNPNNSIKNTNFFNKINEIKKNKLLISRKNSIDKILNLNLNKKKSKENCNKEILFKFYDLFEKSDENCNEENNCNEKQSGISV